MAETGIEDLIQNGPDGRGCLASLGIGLGFVIIVCIILGLVGSYCGPSPDPNTENTNTERRN